MTNLIYYLFIFFAGFCFVGQLNSFAQPSLKQVVTKTPSVVLDQHDTSESAQSIEIISPHDLNGPASAQRVTVSAKRLITLDYTDADLIQVLRAISYSYNINIIITKDLKGKITARLKDFTLDDTLNAILGISDYGYMQKGGIVYVMPKKDLDKITETLPLSFITIKQAVGLLKGASSKFNGTIQENPDSNTLVITATPSDMELIKTYLKSIDVPPIQVMIDAELVNISKKYSSDIGTTISFSYTPSSGLGFSLLAGKGGSTSSSGSGSSSTSSSTSSSSTTSGSSSSTGSSTSGSSSGSDGGIISSTGGWKHISPQVAINALVQQNKARVIASPSIATLNGHEASILIGDHYPYVSSTSIAGGTGGGVVNQTQTQYIDIGTKLKVTPIVSPDGWITLKVEPEVSSVANFVNGNPDISTTSASTEVRVRNNETIVIGGLDSKTDSFDDNSTPGLGSIPVLGWFFHHKTGSHNTGSLTVLITPHIVSMRPAVAVSDPPTVVVDPAAYRGQDANMIKPLLDSAEWLEQDKTKDNAQNLYISEEQIRIYRKILQQFPNSGKSDYCLYKIAFIYGKDFGNCDAAREALTEMKDFSPNSRYLKITGLFVDACKVVNLRKERQKNE